MNSSIYLILFFFLYSGATESKCLLHDIHISQCDIVYDTESSALQITLHIFIDDLEAALRNVGIDSMYLHTDKETDQANEYILSYIADKLKISVDGKPVTYSFLGKEMSDDLFASWCYLEATEMSFPSEIEVTYDLLMEIYADQRNIVKVALDDSKRSYFLFDKDNRTGKFSL